VRHFEESAANPVTIADTHLLIRQPIAFLELPVGEIASTKLPLPMALGVNLIIKNGSMLATMQSQVSLSVADNVEFEPKDMKFGFSRSRYAEHNLWVAKTREPDFGQKLAWPVEVRAGLLQRLETLAEAAQFVVVMEDWRQRRRYWDRAAELILKAATTSKQEDILKATEQLAHALRREGWS
jgi:hypothetical protein